MGLGLWLGLPDGLGKRLGLGLPDGLGKRLSWRLPDGLGKSWGRLCGGYGGLSDGCGGHGGLSDGCGGYGGPPNNAVRVGLRVGKGVINSKSIRFIRHLSKRVGLKLIQSNSCKLINTHFEFIIEIIIMILNYLIILYKKRSSIAILLICKTKFATILIKPNIEESVN